MRPQPASPPAASSPAASLPATSPPAASLPAASPPVARPSAPPRRGSFVARAVGAVSVAAAVVLLGGCFCDLIPLSLLGDPPTGKLQGPLPTGDDPGPPEDAPTDGSPILVTSPQEGVRDEGSPGVPAERAPEATPTRADPGPLPPGVRRDIRPHGPDSTLCLEMYSACGKDGSCTSASFTLECGEIGTVPGGDRVRCVCP